MNLKFLRDNYYWAAIVAALFFWGGLYFWLGTETDFAWPLSEPLVYLKFALLFPVLEEIVFRGLLQENIAKQFATRWGPLTLANLLTSLVFVGLHFFYHPPLWSIVVIVPSLLFGYFKERNQTLLAPISLHVFYNAGYYLLFFQPIT